MSLRAAYFRWHLICVLQNSAKLLLECLGEINSPLNLPVMTGQLTLLSLLLDELQVFLFL